MNLLRIIQCLKIYFKGEFQNLGRYKDVPKIAKLHFLHCTDEQIRVLAP